MGRWRLRVLAGLALAVLVAAVGAMAMDRHGFRLWRQLGRDLGHLEAENGALEARIDRMRHKVDTLRAGPQALERAAYENGYVHSGETLLELK